MASGDKRLLRDTAAYTMDISVGKDRKVGDAKILSVSHTNPEELSQRGVKVYDDIQRVVHEVRSGGTTTLENSAHPWSSMETDELMQHVGQSLWDKASVMVTRTGQAGTGKQATPIEANLKLKGVPAQPRNGHRHKAAESPEASVEIPVSKVHMCEGETRGMEFEDIVQGDVVLIDEDDDRSLREKTVTDMSITDGNAADLVGGRPLSVSSELSSEDKEESSVIELPSPIIQKKKRCQCCTVM